jgi:alcohol dehydrogenase
MIVPSLEFKSRTRVVFGLGSLDRLGELARGLGARRTLVVTDPGIVAAGHLERARRGLASSGIDAAVFDRVRENPTAKDVEDCAAFARGSGIDAIVGLGGGSSMDTAKGANFLLTNGGRMQDYWGYGRASRALLPMIAIPTTSGTGSECQSYALIADENSHQKMACGDPKAAPAVAVLDPSLTVSMPRRVTACTGIDAIAHAVETSVTRKRSDLSRPYSREAFRLMVDALPRALRQPGDLEARAGMQLGAAYAGLAIELSMLGAAHSAANPLTARFDVVHGQAVGMMLPSVVRFNMEDPSARETYLEMSDDLPGRLEALLAAAEMPLSIAGCGVTDDAIPRLAAEAAAQWTAQFNPRAVTAADFESLYRAAMNGQEVPAP